MQQTQETDSALLANNMEGLTTQLNLAYRQFITRAISEAVLRSKILQILNGNYHATLVDLIIKELELRQNLQDQVLCILDDKEYMALAPNQLVLDSNHRVSVPLTIKKNYIEELSKRKRKEAIYCAIFGFTELISEHYEAFKLIFFNERDRKQSFCVMFYLAALHGNLEFMTKVWELAESFGIEKDLITSNDFNAVAAGRASKNPKINSVIMRYAEKVGVAANIPEFTDDQMFPRYARANNCEALLVCWKIPRTPKDYLLLLTDRDCFVFNSNESEMQDETRELLLKFLIILSKTNKIVIPDDIWKAYFSISVKRGSLSSVKIIWEALENESLKKLLLDQAIIDGCDDFHVPIMKFIIEQAESFAENPISPGNIELIEAAAAEGLVQIGELVHNSPLFQNSHQLDK